VLEQAAQTAGAKDHRLGPDDEDLPGAYLEGGYSANPAVFFDKHEPLFVAPDSRFDQLLEHDVQQGLAGEVADKKCSGAALAAKCSDAQLAFVITVEGDTEVLHVDEGLPRRLAHDFDGVLVSQEIAAFDRVVGVVFPVVAPVGKGGVDSALSRIGVAAHRVDFADDGDAGPFSPRRDGRSHSRQPGSNYKDIMLQHGRLFLRSILFYRFSAKRPIRIQVAVVPRDKRTVQ